MTTTTTTLDQVKAYFGPHLLVAEADIKASYDAFLAWFEGKLAKDAAFVAAEIADLTAKGYTVIEPQPANAPPAAPTA